MPLPPNEATRRRCAVNERIREADFLSAQLGVTLTARRCASRDAPALVFHILEPDGSGLHLRLRRWSQGKRPHE